MTEKTIYFVGKIWQTKSKTICFQLKKQSEKDKFFLYLDINSSKNPVFFSKTKNFENLPSGNIAEILRKNLEGSILKEVLKENETYWILFSLRGSNHDDFFLKLDYNKKPYEGSLVSKERKVFFRYGNQGTFTHIKTFEGNFPCENNTSFIPFLENAYNEEKKSPSPTEKESQEEDELPNKELRKTLRKRLKTLKISLRKLEENSHTKEELLKEKENLGLLQSFLSQAEFFEDYLVLKSSITGLNEDILFSADKNLSPGKNLNLLFEKLSKKEKGLGYNEKIRKELENTLETLFSDLERLEKRPFSEEETLELQKKYSLKKQTHQKENKNQKKETLSYKIFMGKNQVFYYVGKSSKDNDSLVKKAKSNDLWFHAAGTQGSHVIVPKSSLKKGVNLEDVKRFAGILALYYSKAKEDRKGEVYASSRQYLKKAKNAAPGLWTVMKSETLFISYTEEELKEILNLMEN
jgi:predicted ribosome quality control (RQC) complex YloA/Tae2 family protein